MTSNTIVFALEVECCQWGVKKNRFPSDAALQHRNRDSTCGNTRRMQEPTMFSQPTVPRSDAVNEDTQASPVTLLHISAANPSCHCARATKHSERKQNMRRPLAHRSCLGGCRAGLDTAWDLGCTGGRHQDCVRSASQRCAHHCGSYRNQFPKPTIFNFCHHSCVDVVQGTCLRAKEVFVAADTLRGVSTDEL